MQKILAKIYPGRSGFIDATLALRDRREGRFGLFEATMTLALMFGGVALMRFVLTHVL